MIGFTLFLAVVLITVKAAHSTIYALQNQWKPWQVGMKGIGGTLFLVCISLIDVRVNLLEQFSFALSLMGISLLFFPSIWETVKRGK